MGKGRRRIERQQLPQTKSQMKKKDLGQRGREWDRREGKRLATGLAGVYCPARRWRLDRSPPLPGMVGNSRVKQALPVRGGSALADPGVESPDAHVTSPGGGVYKAGGNCPAQGQGRNSSTRMTRGSAKRAGTWRKQASGRHRSAWPSVEGYPQVNTPDGRRAEALRQLNPSRERWAGASSSPAIRVWRSRTRSGKGL